MPWPIYANLYLVTYRWSQVPLHHSDLRPRLMIHLVLSQGYVLPWAWAVVLRGTANLPTTSWIWITQRWYVTTISCKQLHAYSLWLVICISIWLTVSAQEPIRHIFHVTVPLLSTHFGLLFAYLFDRPSVLRSQLATSFTSQFPSYLTNLHDTSKIWPTASPNRLAWTNALMY